MNKIVKPKEVLYDKYGIKIKSGPKQIEIELKDGGSVKLKAVPAIEVGRALSLAGQLQARKI